MRFEGRTIALFIIGFLMGFGLMIGGGWALYHPSPSLGVVDAQTLVTMEAQKVVKDYQTGVVPPERLQRIVTRLKQKVDRFSCEHNLILFARGAVWGGELPDYTEVFLEALTEKESPDVQ